jgi:hypothetical protein
MYRTTQPMCQRLAVQSGRCRPDAKTWWHFACFGALVQPRAHQISARDHESQNTRHEAQAEAISVLQRVRLRAGAGQRRHLPDVPAAATDPDCPGTSSSGCRARAVSSRPVRHGGDSESRTPDQSSASSSLSEERHRSPRRGYRARSPTKAGGSGEDSHGRQGCDHCEGEASGSDPACAAR